MTPRPEPNDSSDLDQLHRDEITVAMNWVIRTCQDIVRDHSHRSFWTPTAPSTGTTPTTDHLISGPLARAARAGGPWPPPAPVCRPAQRQPRPTQRATPHQQPTRHSQLGTATPDAAARPGPRGRPAVEGRLRRATYMASRPPTASIAVVRVGTASSEGGEPGHEAGRSSSPAPCGRPPYCRRHGCGCVSRRAALDVAGGEQLLPRGGSARRGRSASVPVSPWLASVSSTHRASPPSNPPRRACLALVTIPFFTWTLPGQGSAKASTTTTPVPSAPGS